MIKCLNVLWFVVWEEGGDDVKSAWPFDTLGDTRDTMAGTEGCQVARRSQSQKTGLSSDRSLQLDSLKSDSLVIGDQNAPVNTFSDLVLTIKAPSSLFFKRVKISPSGSSPERSWKVVAFARAVRWRTWKQNTVRCVRWKAESRVDFRKGGERKEDTQKDLLECAEWKCKWPREIWRCFNFHSNMKMDKETYAASEVSWVIVTLVTLKMIRRRTHS